MFEEDCIDENEKNIIELLLEKDLTRICFKIFSHLDSDSFCNARLVCHGWKDFIDYQFYELPNGIKWRSDKLISNFLDNDFVPKEEKININEEICYIKADEKNVFISTNNKCISNYEFLSLKLMWCLQLNTVNPIFLSSDRLYTYGEYGSDIYIIDRTFGNIVHKISNIFSLDGIYYVTDLSVLENKLLAVAAQSIN